jgi:hypothetical protein
VLLSSSKLTVTGSGIAMLRVSRMLFIVRIP